MPGSIHNGGVRNIRQNFLRSLNSHNVRRHMKRSQINYGTECIKNFRRNQYGFCKFFATVKNAVTNCPNNAHIAYNADFRICNFLDDKFNRFFMSRTRT